MKTYKPGVLAKIGCIEEISYMDIRKTVSEFRREKPPDLTIAN
jgi:hypothetical protein